MARTLKAVMGQIKKLEREAESLRKVEVAGVVSRIKEAIEHYQLTPQDLFGSASGVKRRGPGKSVASAKKGAARKSINAPKYHDGAGRTWTGQGKRPNWFKDALASGKTAEDLLIK